MRPFGEAADLDVDFDEPDRPALVTRLLARGGVAAADFWWGQTVSRRIAALVSLSVDATAVDLAAHCAGCSEALEFSVPLATLAAAAENDAAMIVALDDGATVTLRRPTGADLGAWRAARPASRGEAVRLMLGALLIEGEAGSGAEAAVGEALAMLDPLVAFNVACRCPACDSETQVEIDLEQLALDRLARRQAALVQQVHALAAAYGWTEAEALAVPPKRRAQYLALIEQGR